MPTLRLASPTRTPLLHQPVAVTEEESTVGSSTGQRGCVTSSGLGRNSTLLSPHACHGWPMTATLPNAPLFVQRSRAVAPAAEEPGAEARRPGGGGRGGGAKRGLYRGGLGESFASSADDSTCGPGSAAGSDAGSATGGSAGSGRRGGEGAAAE